MYVDGYVNVLINYTGESFQITRCTLQISYNFLCQVYFNKAEVKNKIKIKWLN